MNLTQVLDKVSSGKTATFAEDVEEVSCEQGKEGFIDDRHSY